MSDERDGDPGPIPEMSVQMRGLYDDTVKNIADTKRRQWEATNYALILLSAEVWVDRWTPYCWCTNLLFTILGVVTIVCACAVVISLIFTLSKFRARLNAIYRKHFTDGEKATYQLKTEDRPWTNDMPFTAVFFAVLLGGAVIGSVAIWVPRP